MGDILTYNAKFPATAGTDVKTQVFSVYTVKVDDAGVEQFTEVVAPVSYPVEVTDANFEVEQDSEVEVRMQHIDDADLVSPVGVQRFTAKDTIAPDAPGVFGEITLVSEKEGEV